MIKKIFRLTPTYIIIIGFFTMIMVGAGLLCLPIATRSGNPAPFMDALFTATSAACVTGLVVHDTYTFWSGFGQGVILMLIQVGGMGVVTMAIAMTVLSGKRIGLRQRFIMQESISAPQVGGIIRMTNFIMRTSLMLEGVGALLLSFRFIPEFGFGKGIWFSVFHSVSAFCNAGFDLMGGRQEFSSITYYAGDLLVNVVIMSLIIIGGLGFFVWDDIKRNGMHFRRYKLQTKFVITVTSFLIIVPSLLIIWIEWGSSSMEGMGAFEKVLSGIFMAVTPRTAGFNSLNLNLLRDGTLLIVLVLMVVGGSTGSTAGGVKTTTMAVLFLSLRAGLKKQESPQCYGRRIANDTVRDALTIFTLYLTILILGTGVVCVADSIPLTEAAFEATSAIGTVGLSMGITPRLGTISRLVLITMMYFGRVGCLTMFYAVAEAYRPAPGQMPLEKISIG